MSPACEHCGERRPVMVVMAGSKRLPEWHLCGPCWSLGSPKHRHAPAPAQPVERAPAPRKLRNVP